MRGRYPGRTEPPMVAVEVVTVAAAAVVGVTMDEDEKIIGIRIAKETCVQDIKCLWISRMLDGTIGSLLHQVTIMDSFLSYMRTI